MTKKLTPAPSESEEQIAVIEYCDLKGIPIYHIANEGKRTRYTGDLLKRMGMRKGFPDLCLPLAKGEYHGFYIEMNHRQANRQRTKFRGLNASKSKAMQQRYATEQTKP